MTTTTEYAQLSSRVYDASLNRNRTFVPTGYTEIAWLPDTTVTGFSAGVYSKDGTNEIVIAYTGTNNASDWVANVGNGAGIASFQVLLAMKLYLDVKAENPGASISFTGHSLGN